MNVARPRRTRIKADNPFYRPLEAAIIAEYLGCRRSLATSLREVEIPYPMDRADWPQAEHGIALYKDDYGRDDFDVALCNAVARICLAHHNECLPQWGGWSQERGLVLGRDPVDPADLPPRVLTPQFLLEINWATSGPGYTWPEAYWATRLPLFDVVVVTASHDTPEITGYNDLTIGWFSVGKDVVQAAGHCIASEWKCQRAENDQQRWEWVKKEGLVTAEQAAQWAQEVWEPEPEEEEEDEDDE